MQTVPQKVCPYCQGGNAPGASRCQWCGHDLPAPTSMRRTWGWLLIFAGIACLLLLGLTYFYMVGLSWANGTSVPYIGAFIMFAGIVLIFFLPGALLLRRKSR